MPLASRSARTASPRSPGSMIFETPSARASTEIAAPRRSASAKNRSGSPKPAMSMAITVPFRNGSSPIAQLSRSGATRGCDNRRLLMHSIINDRPAPFAPPSGSSVSTAFGSVVSRPSLSRPQPTGIFSPRSAAPMILPLATTPVEKSNRYGRPFLRGTANAIGLDDTAGTLVPG